MTRPFTLPHTLVPLASISLIWLYIEQPCPVPFILALLYCSWLIFALLCPLYPSLSPSVHYTPPLRYTNMCAIHYPALYVLCTAMRCVLLTGHHRHSYSIKPALLFVLQACHDGDGYSEQALLTQIGSILAGLSHY